MNIVIRTDASTVIGTGHIMRCRSLALEMKNRGFRVTFIVRDLPGHLGWLLVQDGLKVELLPRPISISNSKDYSSWLGVSQYVDAEQTLSIMRSMKCHLLIVDHYGLDQIWESLLRNSAERIMVIDDLCNRFHNCDLLLDQNYSLQGPERYSLYIPEFCKLLLGPRYALLRPEFRRARKLPTHHSKEVQRVLIYFGGSDINNLTCLALRALSNSRFARLNVDVVVGPNFEHLSELQNLSACRSRTEIYSTSVQLSTLMSSADLAIGAGGGTMWERACMGLPSLVVSLAENQVAQCEAMSAAGLIEYLGSWQTLGISDFQRFLFKNTPSSELLFAKQCSAMALVDGLGVLRVANALSSAKDADFKLRPAEEADIFTYFSWVNDPLVRDNSVYNGPIDFSDHLPWFSKKLTDTNGRLLLLECRGLPVGQIRFDWDDERIVMHYSLDALSRGCGLGKKLILMGTEYLRSIDTIPLELEAFVKRDNVPSIKTILATGFSEVKNDVVGLRRFRLILRTQKLRRQTN